MPIGRRVLCCGTFDYLHPGHISFLQQAARLGDELVVVVARDENVKRIKGRYPDHSEEERKVRVETLGIAADVRLGYPGNDLLKVVADIRPQVIALGYDQGKPPGLEKAFPDCQIVVLEPHCPDRFKSSIFRRARPAR
jgi:FAD synthetase